MNKQLQFVNVMNELDRQTYKNLIYIEALISK